MKTPFAVIREEWQYVYDERIAIMREAHEPGSPPTQQEEREARLCADRHVQELAYSRKIET